jgi:beta-lactamase regulating signal transducer with metallopeptidase domain
MTMVLLAWTVKSSLLLAIAIGVAALLRGRSAAVRHAVLTAGIVSALSVPIVSSLSPEWMLPQLVVTPRYTALSPRSPSIVSSTPPVAASAALTTRARSAAAGNVLPALPWLWLAGASLFVVLLARGLVMLAAIERRCVVPDDPRWQALVDRLRASFPNVPPIRLLMSEEHPLPVTWGARAPRILLPAAASEWPLDRCRAVLLHELAHIARHDWVLHLAAETLRVVFWFNPLAFVACRRLRQESEIACDDRVLAAGVSGADYATHLLVLARSLHGGLHQSLPASAIVEATTLERRIQAMLNAQLNRAPVGRRVGVLVALVSAIVAAAVAAGAAQSFATFAGSVVDPTNAALPQVTFQLTNADSGAKYEVMSDRTGRVELPGLPPGDYAIEARLAGFKTFRSRVRLGDGQRFEPALILQVGELEETVTTTDPGPGVDERPRIVTGRARSNPACPSAATTDPRVGGNIRPPQMIRHVSPVYPVNLRGSGRSGIVELKGRIAPDGHIEEITTIASADPDFEAAAIEAVSGWQYDSTLLNCMPWPVDMRVHVQFAAGQ